MKLKFTTLKTIVIHSNVTCQFPDLVLELSHYVWTVFSPGSIISDENYSVDTLKSSLNVIDRRENSITHIS